MRALAMLLVAMMLVSAAPAYAELNVRSLRDGMTAGGSDKDLAIAMGFVSGVRDGVTIAGATCDNITDPFKTLDQIVRSERYPDSMLAAVAVWRHWGCKR